MLFKLKLNPKKVILVEGTGRSGTTWLAEAINSNLDYRIVFEPFTKAPKARQGWSSSVGEQHIYLDRNDDFEHKEILEKVFAGKIKDSPWVNRVKTSKKKSRKILVKDIRLNFMMGYIQQNFPEIKIIFLVRDPYSTAFSAANRIWVKGAIKLYLSRQRMVNRYFTEQQVKLLRKAEGKFQISIAKWVMENYVALKSMEKNQNTTSVYYENLVRQPEAEFARLADLCGHKFDSSVLDLSKKSTTANPNSVTSSKSKKFGRLWDEKLTKADMDYAEEVLKSFGLDRLYKDRNVPAFDQPLDWVKG